jgi:hypothetical protein
MSDCVNTRLNVWTFVRRSAWAVSRFCSLAHVPAAAAPADVPAGPPEQFSRNKIRDRLASVYLHFWMPLGRDAQNILFNFLATLFGKNFNCT